MNKPIVTLDVSGALLNRLRGLMEIPHEHPDGRNECAICDKPVLEALAEEIEYLRQRCEEADGIILQLTREHCGNTEYQKGFVRAAEYFHTYPSSANPRPLAANSKKPG